MAPTDPERFDSSTPRPALGRWAWLALALIALGLGGAACGGDDDSAADEAPTGDAAACVVTPAEDEEPNYRPGAPMRESVGSEYRLTGRVRSADACRALPGALVELWLANPDGIYDDAHRATVTADARGRFRFASNRPVAYLNQSPHIHMRVSAAQHAPVLTIHRPSGGATDGASDVILAPE